LIDRSNSQNTRNKSDALQGFMAGHALIIGIAEYPAMIGRLPDAVRNDAKDVFDVLVNPRNCGYDASRVELLLDSAATLASIRRGLASLAQRARQDDTVLIYFSGHGARLTMNSAPSSALVPIDFEPTRHEATSLMELEFSKALEQIKAKKLLILLDACHAGGAASLKGAPGAVDLILGYEEKTLARLSEGIGRVLIASSRATEVSNVFNGARNSVFTQHALEAFQGRAHSRGDGLIRVFDFFNYIAEKVQQSLPGRQHPIFKASELEDNFPIALTQANSPREKQTTPAPVDDWKRLHDLLADLYPAGPTDKELWQRAGGDLSHLNLAGSGRTTWFSALRVLRHGGGGGSIGKDQLVRVMRDDFPHHPELEEL